MNDAVRTYAEARRILDAYFAEIGDGERAASWQGRQDETHYFVGYYYLGCTRYCGDWTYFVSKATGELERRGEYLPWTDLGMRINAMRRAHDRKGPRDVTFWDSMVMDFHDDD